MTEQEIKTDKKSKPKPKAKGKNIALKDFTICHNETLIEIKEGDDVSKLDIPDIFMDNLITEKVLKG